MSCVRCHGPDSGTTDLCHRCEAEYGHEQTVDDVLEPGRPWAPGYCWLAQFADTSCEGRIDPAHLIPKQLLKREHIEDVWHPAVWVPACRKHHGMLDTARTLRIPRESLPVGLEAFAEAHGVSYWLEREYGRLEKAA